MLLLHLACTGGPPAPSPQPPPVPAAEPAPATWSDQATPDALPVNDPAREGPVFLRLERGARSWFVRLDAAGLARVDAPSADDLHRAPDGSVWALGGQRAWRLDGGGAVEGVPDGMLHLALDPGGRVVVAGREILARWDGALWVEVPLSGLGEERVHPMDLVVDREGRPWLSTLDGVHRFDGSGWTALPLPAEPIAPIPGVLRLGSAAEFVVLGSSGGWWTHDGSAWTRHTEVSAQDGLDVQPGVRVLAASYGTIDVTRDGAEQRTPRPEGSASLGAASVDTRGRAWVASDLGLHRVEDGVVTTWLSASDPLLTGTIAQVMVVGAGPAALPAPGPARTSDVTVRFTRAGAPLANAGVELCPQPQMLYSGETPCAGSAYRARATTDVDGIATFSGVPRADLRLVFQADGGWKGVLGTALECCGDLEAGSVDLGTVELPAN